MLSVVRFRVESTRVVTLLPLRLTSPMLLPFQMVLTIVREVTSVRTEVLFIICM